jgi:DNA invertase Pin-like site-specific DNA recombinase
LADEGFSAYKGDNISKGKFGRFLERAGKGQWRGYALVVENQDRISRQGIVKSGNLLTRLSEAGIEVHFTQDNRVIRTLDEVEPAVMSILYAHNAKEHSKKLSDRLGKVWANKKQTSEPGISITGKLPGWLHGRTGEPITVDKDKAKVVRKIFEMAAKGQGKRLIARQLNQQGIPTFGGGRCKAEKWVHSYVHKILFNRATLGEFQPYKGKGRSRSADGERRENFFPVVVTSALWDRAHAAISSRRSTTANGETTGKYAGRTGKLHNLFSGLVYDATLRLPMHYRDKGKRDKPRLATISKEVDGTPGNSITYAPFEKAFLNWLDQLDWTEIVDITDSSEIAKIEGEIAALNLQIGRTETLIQTLVDQLLLLSSPAAALNTKLLQLEAKVAADKGTKEAADKRLAEARNKHRDVLDESVLYAALSKARDLETRARLRQEIRRKVSRIEIFFGKKARSFMGADALSKVYFVNGVERWIAFGAGLAVQIYPEGDQPPYRV